MQYAGATYYRSAASDDDGGMLEETLDEVLPNEFLCVIIKRWCINETKQYTGASNSLTGYWIVQHVNVSFAVGGSCKSNTLLLASGEADAFLRNRSVGTKGH
jgi:hypothetical protein